MVLRQRVARPLFEVLDAGAPVDGLRALALTTAFGKVGGLRWQHEADPKVAIVDLGLPPAPYRDLERTDTQALRLLQIAWLWPTPTPIHPVLCREWLPTTVRIALESVVARVTESLRQLSHALDVRVPKASPTWTLDRDVDPIVRAYLQRLDDGR